MNVSLTAISLLWNAADVISKDGTAPAAGGQSRSSKDQHVIQPEALLRQLMDALQVQPPTKPIGLPPACKHRCISISTRCHSTAIQSQSTGHPRRPSGARQQRSQRQPQCPNLPHAAWRACDAFAVRVQSLSTDTRPEVRNTGVRTLFQVANGQGGRISEAAWNEAVWDILFPLLQRVHQMAATSSRTEVQRLPSWAPDRWAARTASSRDAVAGPWWQCVACRVAARACCGTISVHDACVGA